MTTLPRTLYVCGKLRDDDPECWEFFGIFSTQALAIGACSTVAHFVGPVMLDVELSGEPETWPDAVFPVSS